MKNLTVIIPVYNINTESHETMFKNAVNSVDDSKIIVIGPEADITKVKNIDGLNNKITTVINPTEDTTYSTQVNMAVKQVKTEYFSILEFDDVYTSIWFSNLKTYMDKIGDETFAFLPLTEVMDLTNNTIIGYANEAVWASSFSEEMGYFDLQCLEDYLNFSVSGGVFKTDEFINLGMLKTSMKLSFWYEYLLRALYRGKKIFVIPKVGYIHTIGRDDCLTSYYFNNMDERESGWWIDIAKKEYFFPHDRNKTYNQE